MGTRERSKEYLGPNERKWREKKKERVIGKNEFYTFSSIQRRARGVRLCVSLSNAHGSGGELEK